MPQITRTPVLSMVLLFRQGEGTLQTFTTASSKTRFTEEHSNNRSTLWKKSDKYEIYCVTFYLKKTGNSSLRWSIPVQCLYRFSCREMESTASQWQQWHEVLYLNTVSCSPILQNPTPRDIINKTHKRPFHVTCNPYQAVIERATFTHLKNHNPTLKASSFNRNVTSNIQSGVLQNSNVLSALDEF